MNSNDKPDQEILRPEMTPGQDPGAFSDLNPHDFASDTKRDPMQEWDQGKQSAQPNRITDPDQGAVVPVRTQPTLPQEKRDGQVQPQDQSRDSDPSFVKSGVSDGGQEGKFGQDEYKDRRNE